MPAGGVDRRAGARLAGGARPAPKRAIALRRCALEVAAGRIDLDAHDVRRLLAIPEIGAWTVEMLALYGRGAWTSSPPATSGFIKLVGRIARAIPGRASTEAEVREFFEPYGEWRGLRRRVPRAAPLRPGLIQPDGPVQPSPGRNSLVSAAPPFGARLSSLLRCIQRA